MGEYTVKKIDEMEAKLGGGFKLARASLGVESFGMQIMDFPPNFSRHPAHDHSGDGQEEVYVVLRGSGEVEIEGERVPIDPETVVRVVAGTSRRLVPGPEGMRVLALGGTPGRAYEPPEMSKPEGVGPRLP